MNNAWLVSRWEGTFIIALEVIFITLALVFALKLINTKTKLKALKVNNDKLLSLIREHMYILPTSEDGFHTVTEGNAEFWFRHILDAIRKTYEEAKIAIGEAMERPPIVLMHMDLPHAAQIYEFLHPDGDDFTPDEWEVIDNALRKERALNATNANDARRRMSETIEYNEDIAHEQEQAEHMVEFIDDMLARTNKLRKGQ